MDQITDDSNHCINQKSVTWKGGKGGMADRGLLRLVLTLSINANQFHEVRVVNHTLIQVPEPKRAGVSISLVGYN